MRNGTIRSGPNLYLGPRRQKPALGLVRPGGTKKSASPPKKLSPKIKNGCIIAKKPPPINSFLKKNGSPQKIPLKKLPSFVHQKAGLGAKKSPNKKGPRSSLNSAQTPQKKRAPKTSKFALPKKNAPPVDRVPKFSKSFAPSVRSKNPPQKKNKCLLKKRAPKVPSIYSVPRAIGCSHSHKKTPAPFRVFPNKKWPKDFAFREKCLVQKFPSKIPGPEGIALVSLTIYRSRCSLNGLHFFTSITCSPVAGSVVGRTGWFSLCNIQIK